MTTAELISSVKSIAASIQAKDLEAAAEQADRIMAHTNGDVLALFDVLAKEGAKKRPNEKLVMGSVFLLMRGLEGLRFKIEEKDQRSTDLGNRAVMTIHRQDYAATDADALREFPRHALAGKQFPDRLIAESISGD